MMKLTNLLKSDDLPSEALQSIDRLVLKLEKRWNVTFLHYTFNKPTKWIYATLYFSNNVTERRYWYQEKGKSNPRWKLVG